MHKIFGQFMVVYCIRAIFRSWSKLGGIRISLSPCESLPVTNLPPSTNYEQLSPMYELVVLAENIVYVKIL